MGLNSIAALASIVSLVLGVVFYLASIQAPAVTFAVSPERATIVNAGQASGLRVTHNGQPIGSDVTSVRIAVWNDGREPVDASNTLVDPVLVMEPRAHILEVRVTGCTRADVVTPAPDLSRCARGELPLRWRILERGDQIGLQVIYAGPVDTGISLRGAFRGQPYIYKPKRRICSNIFTQLGLVASLVSLLLVLRVIWSLIAVFSLRRQTSALAARLMEQYTEMCQARTKLERINCTDCALDCPNAGKRTPAKVRERRLSAIKTVQDEIDGVRTLLLDFLPGRDMGDGISRVSRSTTRVIVALVLQLVLLGWLLYSNITDGIALVKPPMGF